MPKIVDHQKRFEEIGKLAAIALAEHGHEKLTFVEFAKRAGCSVGAINHYAKTKDDIILMASKFVIDDLMKRLGTIRENYSGITAFQKALYEYLPCSSAYSRRDDNLIFSLWAKVNDNPDIRGVLSDNRKWCENYFTGLIKEAQEKRQVAAELDPMKLAQQTLSHVDALTLKIRVTGRRPPASEQILYADEWIGQLAQGSAASEIARA